MSPTVAYPQPVPTAPSSFVPRGDGYLGGYSGPTYPNAYSDVNSEGDVRTERDEIDINEVPAIIWQDKYDTDHKGLYKQIQHLSDYLLARGPSVYQHDNPNTRKCRDVYWGKTDPKDYDTAAATYGMPGVAEIKDYGFLYTVGQRIIGGKLQMPFQFEVKDVSPTAREKRLSAVVDQFAEMATRAVASALNQKSEADGAPADFGFLKNPNVNPEAPVDLPSTEEKTLNALLRDSVLRYKTQDEMRLAIEDKTQLNAQAAHIVVQGDDVFAERVDIESVSWVAPGRIRTAEDCSAIGIRDYMPLPDIFTEYGHRFGSRGVAATLKDTVKALRKGTTLNYRPRVFQLQDGRNNADLADYITTSIAGDGNTVFETTNWQHEFYPWIAGDPSIMFSSNPVTVLRHRLYFRVIKFKPAKVLINGKPPTTEVWQRYLHRNYDQQMDLSLKLLKDGEKAKAGDVIQKIPTVEIWQATRLGHNLLMDVGRCTHAPTNVRQPKKKHWPIVLSVSYKRGIGCLSLEFVRLWNVLWNRIDELLLLAGAGSVTWIDEAQMDYQEAQTLRSAARKTGWAFFNSSRLQDRTNRMAERHLTRTQLGDEENKVQALFALAGLIKATFDGMIGVGQAAQGQAGAYDSTSKLNFLYNQQTAVTQEFYHEDTLFNNEVLQRISEIQRVVKAKDDWAEVQYEGKGGVRITKSIKLSKALADTWPMVRLENGPKMQKIQQDIEVMATQALASGAAGLREIIKLKFADNVYEALDIFDSGLTTLEQLQAQQQQIQLQINQQKAQADAQKTQIPLQVEQLRGQNALAAIEAKQQGERQKEDFKGNLADTQEQWKREGQVQQSELEKDRTAFEYNALPQDQPAEADD